MRAARSILVPSGGLAARPISRKSEIVESSSSLIKSPDQNYRNSAFGFQRNLLINQEKYENRAGVHFIPNRKVGVFVALCAPDVIKMPLPFEGGGWMQS